MILLEDTWTLDGEADDIIQFSIDNKIEYKILSVDELINLNSKYFLKNSYFCNTDIVQLHLENLNKSYLVPDTYDDKFKTFYDREIEKMTISEFINKYNGITRFIKPVKNNKEFDGRVIDKITDFELYGVKIPTESTEIYCCQPIIFLSEVRLLIGNGKLYGHGHICKNEIENYINEIQTFVNDIIKASDNNYYCIDIGYIFDKKTKLFKWIIIEINPPFSLDDHKIPIDDYMNFCIDACHHIYLQILKN